jgi:hypothetical protein
MRELPDERASLPRHRHARVAGRRQADRKAGIEMATGKTNGIGTSALGATMALVTLMALAGCSVQRPGAAQDHSLETVERNRAAMGVAPADTSYEQAEHNRLTLGTWVDTSYADIERLRAGRVGR